MFKFLKISLILVLSIFTCLVLSNNVLAYYLPHSSQVRIYSDANFRGAAQTLREGCYNMNQLAIGNDTLSSLRVPRGWRVTLYENADFQGRTKTFTADSGWVGNDFNDLTSSIRVERVYPNPPIGPHGREVSIYSDANFRGAAQTLREGWYNMNQLAIGNDTLSSLRVPQGWRVTLYENADFQGRTKTFTADTWWVGNDFNDLTSSIRVERVYPNPPIGPHGREVSIYVDANFQGAGQTLREGWYNMNQLAIGNDSLSSLRVPRGWRVTLYENADFQGRTKTFTADSGWVGNDFNDLTSSIRVEYIGF